MSEADKGVYGSSRDAERGRSDQLEECEGGRKGADRTSEGGFPRDVELGPPRFASPTESGEDDDAHVDPLAYVVYRYFLFGGTRMKASK